MALIQAKTSQYVSVAGYIVTSANIVGQCHEVNSDPDKINGLEN